MLLSICTHVHTTNDYTIIRVLSPDALAPFIMILAKRENICENNRELPP